MSEGDVEPVDFEDIDTDPTEYDALADAAVVMRVNEHGLYIVDDEETAVSSQGQTPEQALANLAEAVDSYREASVDETGDDWL
ncbi:type II toxin-antitoxin system HicB family antitoxin [Natronobacterium gregoryi]|uniref:Type II toxin-antitoxin system HicB family antitoxin n=2 Tax=Natronobacterium gregoryi TaxID=44930 RepID=L0AFS2_NATGS|nr:hypothetical protein [Natronobacterium gregoryi]AFZ72763.1 hypothetical protein Natgr_1558 [Natronobacterium gregoryi SP2]ELY69472.1 hypothetical protein C490_08109 [Natronobacterium gregoryi SP2]PLK21106.1 hypothetical protein CYV19_05595 [Natronobacterium gregoryi SP2]SFJ11405.1 hypothetical protein SAMN05443661_11476 [Natronobacterium gregoryi]